MKKITIFILIAFFFYSAVDVRGYKKGADPNACRQMEIVLLLDLATIAMLWWLWDVTSRPVPTTSTTTITQELDSDDDGVSDSDDQCPKSDLSDTVFIAEVNCEIENKVNSVGCTINDKIAECGNEPVCFSNLLFALIDNDDISFEDWENLVSCLAEFTASNSYPTQSCIGDLSDPPTLFDFWFEKSLAASIGILYWSSVAYGFSCWIEGKRGIDEVDLWD